MHDRLWKDGNGQACVQRSQAGGAGGAVERQDTEPRGAVTK